MALQSQMEPKDRDSRFYYEPLLKPHPVGAMKPFSFLGKTQKVPMWVSSMTGGTKLARKINTNLARVCREFGMGMGLGSCRVILSDDTHFNDFNMRPVIGNELPLYANLGISQIEQSLKQNTFHEITELVNRLQADGLIIHVNPMQEWIQPEGDRLTIAPIETIKKCINKADFNVIVKEVGQGMGPESLRQLMRLPLAAIEFASFGGTNFAKIELMRSDLVSRELFEPFATIGEDAESMVGYVNSIASDEHEKVLCRQVIISGGIRNFLDGYFLISKLSLPAVYGQASAYLRHAKEDYDDLYRFVELQVKGYMLASSYLTIHK